ncbi:MAG: adenylosuccinate synthetase, partial [Myxococcales bacterium]|nr:adenylosuccinate synthetase [Myxococcales bacterium]
AVIDASEATTGVTAASPATADDRDAARALIARGEDRDLLEAFLDAAQRPITITDTPPAAAHVILESAQGALLDRDHGFFPHVTPSRITRAAAELAAHQLRLTGPLDVWGVLRAYHTRHGEGPLPSEDPTLTARLPERHNREDGPAGRFRVGWFDAVLARHALAFAGPIDHLAVTCFDRLAALPQHAIVDAWRDPSAVDTASAIAAIPVVRPVDSLVTAIETALGRPIDVQSWGPTASAKRPSLASPFD